MDARLLDHVLLQRRDVRAAGRPLLARVRPGQRGAEALLQEGVHGESGDSRRARRPPGRPVGRGDRIAEHAVGDVRGGAGAQRGEEAVGEQLCDGARMVGPIPVGDGDAGDLGLERLLELPDVLPVPGAEPDVPVREVHGLTDRVPRWVDRHHRAVQGDELVVDACPRGAGGCRAVLEADDRFQELVALLSGEVHGALTDVHDRPLRDRGGDGRPHRAVRHRRAVRPRRGGGRVRGGRRPGRRAGRRRSTGRGRP